jgi:hypothetical protein
MLCWSARGRDQADRLGGHVGQGDRLQQLGEAEDGVQRGAQLVAHPRQVLALGLVGLLGGQLGQAQLLLEGRLLGDVPGDQHDPGRGGQGPAVASRVSQCPSAWRARRRTAACSAWPVSTRRWASLNRSRSSGWMMSEPKALRPTRSSGGRPRIRWTAGLMERMPPSASRMVMMSGEALMTAWSAWRRPVAVLRVEPVEPEAGRGQHLVLGVAEDAFDVAADQGPEVGDGPGQLLAGLLVGGEVAPLLGEHVPRHAGLDRDADGDGHHDQALGPQGQVGPCAAEHPGPGPRLGFIGHVREVGQSGGRLEPPNSRRPVAGG